MVNRRLLVVGLILAVLLSTVACFAHRVRDYAFDVTGIVIGDDSSPLKDVEITLQTAVPVYEGITPVKTKRIVSPDGTFIFMYITGDPNTEYTITVRKEGFQTQVVSGSSPPAANHRIQLKRAPADLGVHVGQDALVRAGCTRRKFPC